MRKKLMISMLTILTLSLIILTVLFSTIINHQYTESLKKSLKENNNFIISLMNTENIKDEKTLFMENFKKLDMRMTLIDKTGKVLYDSMADSETMDNHNTRPEIVEARKSGSGYSERFSRSVQRNMLYYATAFDDGLIMRSSIPMDLIKSFEGMYIKYYIIIVGIVLLLGIIISLKLSRIILNPIKDLKYTSSLVARGELDRRVYIDSKDEIGDLGKTFNDMADKLQYTIKDSLEKQNRLSAILKSMDSGVIAVDRNNKVLMINPYAEQIFGINKDIIGVNLMDIIRDFELEELFKNKNEEYKEIRILWPKERDLRIRTADIINEYGPIGKVAVVQDISDIKRLENIRSQFVANVSHELKTPLTSIKGFAETLRYVEDNETKEKFLGIIDDETERLSRLINDILTLSDIEQHRENKVEDININSTIKDVINLVKKTADSKEISLSFNENEVPSISGDTDRFKQMMINLVDNAIKYSEHGDSVTVGTKVIEENISICVEDTGVGISKEHIDRIFERFYRVDKARSRAQGGTGLGLAIVKHIVLSLGGNINVESELGKGTKFTITIPFKKAD